MSIIRYRPEIDGLRALAVTAVVLFHLYPQWILGGYLGVDVFFVISGYLITSIIFKEAEKGTFSITQFMLRRVRRIIPALVFLLLVCAVLGPIFLLPALIPRLGEQSLFALLSVSNIYFYASTGGYWDVSSEWLPLLNLWSLSVEEQFYLIYPWFFVLLLKRSRWIATCTLSIIFISSLIGFYFGIKNYQAFTFYMLPMRAWELLAGGLLFLFLHHIPALSRLPRFVYQLTALLGLGIMLFAFFAVTRTTGISPYAIIAVAGAVLVIASTHKEGNLCQRLLAWAPVVFLGKISYSLYLWHWPVLVMCRNSFYFEGEHLMNMVAVALFVPASLVSYFWIEQPFRIQKFKTHYLIPATFIAVMLSTILVFHQNDKTTMPYTPTESYGHEYEYDSSSETIGVGNAVEPEVPLDVLIIGDSYAMMHAKMLNDILDEAEAQYVFLVSPGACPYFPIPLQYPRQDPYALSPEELYQFNQHKLDIIRNRKPKLVTLAGRWPMYIDFGEDGLDDVLMEIGASGGQALLIGGIPTIKRGPANTAEVLDFLRIEPSENRQYYAEIVGIPELEGGEAQLMDFASRYDWVDYVKIEDIFRNGNQTLILDGYDVLYADSTHVSEAGVRKAEARIREAILNLLNAKGAKQEPEISEQP